MLPTTLLMLPTLTTEDTFRRAFTLCRVLASVVRALIVGGF